MDDKFLSYIPLLSVIPEGLWPDHFLDSQDGSLLDLIAYEDGEIGGTEEEWSAWARVQAVEEIAFPIPFLKGLMLVLGNGPIEAALGGRGIEWEGEITGEVFKLRFGREIFKPLIEQDGELIADPDENHFVEIVLPVGFAANSQKGVSPIWPGEEETPINLPKCMIGDTGILIEAVNLIFHLDGISPLPAEYAHLGLADNWKGLLIERAQVTLPPDLAVDFGGELAFEHCAIGDGGFSGKLAYTPVPAKTGSLLGIGFELKSVKLEFAQNSLNEAAISGALDLPIFDKPIGVKVKFNDQGKFDIELDSLVPSYKLKLPGISNEDIVINNPEFALHTTGDDKCAALRWTEMTSNNS